MVALLKSDNAFAKVSRARAILLANRINRGIAVGCPKRCNESFMALVRCRSTSNRIFDGPGKGSLGESLITRSESSGTPCSAQPRAMNSVSISMAAAPWFARFFVAPQWNRLSTAPSKDSRDGWENCRGPNASRLVEQSRNFPQTRDHRRAIYR